MNEFENKPDYVFEVSWEVCNKIGGIYTVLSTQAKALNTIYSDKLIYIGPDFEGVENIFFKEDKSLFKKWISNCNKNNVKVRAGRWNIPGEPIVVLIDHRGFAEETDAFLYEMWDHFKVDSMEAYGDYKESVLFGYATAKLIENFCQFHKIEKKKIVAQFHEWTTGSGLLYTKIHCPYIKTLFTTHATTTGRSICFNGKALYEYFSGYNGDQMACELNVKAKHLVEKNAALQADCFTTVSDITARECKQLLGKEPDIVTPNGFEDDFVPRGAQYTKKRKEARKTLKNVAEKLIGYEISDDVLFIGTSGRYEFRNKGIDLFLESLRMIACDTSFKREIVAFILVPGWNMGARKDLQQKLSDPEAKFHVYRKIITHEIYNFMDDKILHTMRMFHFDNEQNQNVKVILVPSYLNGDDGIFNKSYYDLLIGLDLTIFASYYEPWGYTPLESAVFSIPTITTDLAGFGLWCSSKPVDISNGVAVIHRTDTNYFAVADEIQNNIKQLAEMNKKETENVHKKALALAKKCSWDDFIQYYQKAFDIALSKQK
ncbi:MAG: glycogen/starch synthase [Paludibacteraceae bacterium]|nr:glycogen/starch synthase [Paludibacteraceae bacterium]